MFDARRGIDVKHAPHPLSPRGFDAVRRLRIRAHTARTVRRHRSSARRIVSDWPASMTAGRRNPDPALPCLSAEGGYLRSSGSEHSCCYRGPPIAEGNRRNWPAYTSERLHGKDFYTRRLVYR